MSPKKSEPVLSSYEAKMLYTLLDAAHDDGLLKGTPFESRWTALKDEVSRAVSFAACDRAGLYRFVGELAAAGILNNTWMLERWLKVKKRVEDDPMEFPASQAPFV